MLLSESLIMHGIPTIFEWTPNVCKQFGHRQWTLEQSFDRACRYPIVTFANRSLYSVSLRRMMCTDAPSTGRCRAVAAINEEGIVGHAERLLPNISKVSLQRTNLMKAGLSRMGLWKNHATNTANHRPRFVNFTQLVQHIPRHHRVHTSRLKVDYETLSRDFPTVLHQIQGFIGEPEEYIRPARPSRLKKSISDNLSSIVINFHEIDQKLAKWPCLQSMWRDTNGSVYETKCLDDAKDLSAEVLNYIPR